MATPVGNAPDAMNGKNSTVPAVPSPAVNGNTANHDRNPSLTVTPSATFTANGGPVGGSKPSNIVFGQQYAGSSPALTTPSLAQHSNNALGVNQLNFRSVSPQLAPSPIPQPASVSGGRPPSSLQSHSGIHFGQQPGDSDTNGLVRPIANLHFGSNEHMRRSSSQSMHADMGNSGLPTGPGRNNYPPQGGRGRGYQNFQPPMTYSPRQTFHPGPNGRGQQPNYHGQGRPSMPYQGSPSLAVRSPAMMPSNPGTPANQMHMVPGMQGQPNGYHMGYQVKIQFPSPSQPTRGKSSKKTRSAQRGGRGTPRGGNNDRRQPSTRGPASEHFRPNSAVMPPGVLPHFYPDLSPESGNFEHFLTSIPQGFPMPTVADPSIQQAYQQQMFMHAQYPNYAPSSPRPQYQQSYPPQMQPTFSSQGHQPPSMSRQSSQMSVPDRPASSIGQTPSQTPSMAGASMQPTQRAPSVSQPKPSFNPPPRKSAAIQIKNAAGEVVTFGKAPASPSVATPQTASTAVPSTPPPPSRTGSAVEKNEVPTVKDDSAEEKRKAMQEAVAKKVADEARLRKEKEEAEQKVQMEQEAAQLARKEAEEKELEAKRLEEEAERLKAQEVEAPKAPETEKPAEDPTPAPAPEAATTTQVANGELDLDALAAEMEREEAEREAEEARKEEEYLRKKAAKKEEELQRQKEEQEAYELNLKEEEKRAEEAELAREKERAEGGTDDASRKMFAALKAGEAPTPTGTDSPPAQTPAESGTATPVSDISMPPPARGTTAGKRNKVADLTLDIKKSIEPPEPSATLKSLTTARNLDDLSKLSYPAGVASPNPALNDKAPPSRGFKYDKDFLLQFRDVFKEKPSIDWEVKIREAMGDGDPSTARQSAGGRTPSGMGGRSASNRPTQASNFTPMGAFGGPARTLPPNTTSEQRFAASNVPSQRPGMSANPFAQFSRGQPGMQMGRTPSSNPLTGMPSPRVGTGPSRGGSRAESKRSKQNTKHSAEENKSMPLTAGMQFDTLQVSSTGWKPRSIGQPIVSGPALGGDGLLDPETVQRKVKSMLNKMTPDNFQRITDQVLEIASQSKHESDGRTLRQVIQLTFEKATDEAHWASMYAMFCRKTLESMSSEIKDENIKDKNGNVVTGGNLFRKYLLNRCQEEFERGWKVNLPPKPEGQSDEAVMLSDEYYIAAAAKRRGLGLVKFIGELFKLQMLTERIMHECVKKLVDYDGTPDEAEVESLASLLRTVGKQLDDPESKAQPRMNVYFDRITQTINNPELPSRLRYMLMDVVDLRRAGWKSKDSDKGPKTIEQVHAEAEEAAKQKELQRLAAQANRGGGGGGRMPMGRGDARQFGGYGAPPPDTTSRVGTDDLRKLGARSTRNASNAPGGPSLGPPSMMGARTNSGRRGLGPGTLLARGAEDSSTSSRNGTPPTQKDKDKKDESSTNAFSALAALETQDGPASPPSNPASPPTSNVQPTVERERSRSPEKSDE